MSQSNHCHLKRERGRPKFDRQTPTCLESSMCVQHLDSTCVFRRLLCDAGQSIRNRKYIRIANASAISSISFAFVVTFRSGVTSDRCLGASVYHRSGSCFHRFRFHAISLSSVFSSAEIFNLNRPSIGHCTYYFRPEMCDSFRGVC